MTVTKTRKWCFIYLVVSVIWCSLFVHPNVSSSTYRFRKTSHHSFRDLVKGVGYMIFSEIDWVVVWNYFKYRVTLQSPDLSSYSLEPLPFSRVHVLLPFVGDGTLIRTHVNIIQPKEKNIFLINNYRHCLHFKDFFTG